MNSNDLLKELLAEQKQTNQWLQYIAGYSKKAPDILNIENETPDHQTGERARMILFTSLNVCRGETVQRTREFILDFFERRQLDTATQNAVKELFEIEVAYSTFNPPSLNALTGKEEPE
ncbi:hypothetical protein I6N96_03335 [Enterococcus sp. BWM-S5]|uniref:Uncharacterized protein n=1 Tax=Enterococcus larvae TaxID=2794352 RepID=A0ABS4CGL0_9ENTE|nr:hypothetical protein [Enterococcus larvae]MBP1045296.1 hypothetical protein [Enterococcus larvae]